MTKSGTHPSQIRIHTGLECRATNKIYRVILQLLYSVVIKSKYDNTYFMEHFQIDENALRKSHYGNHWNNDNSSLSSLAYAISATGSKAANVQDAKTQY